MRIERTDTVGTDRGAIVSRVTAAALRNDVSEARRELTSLNPADRAPAQGWLDKASERDAALSASHRFAAEAMAALARVSAVDLRCIGIILFLLLIALAALGTAWLADQPGEVMFPWAGGRAHVTLLEFAIGFGVAVIAAMLAWSILRALWRLPEKIRKARHERRQARGRHAITQGLLAIGHGDSAAARLHADMARRHAAGDPLTLLLHAQSAQLDGNRDAAREAFHAMADARGYKAVGPARIVHRGAARRRCRCRGRDRGRGAEDLAVVDLGLAGSCWASAARGGDRVKKHAMLGGGVASA